MLEKFCVGLVRILLGGILFFLTLLSAVVTCRVYGGSEIVQKAFFGPITPQVPASVLQLHNDVTLVADEAALSKLSE